MAEPIRRVFTINIFSEGGMVTKTWMFLVPVEMTPDAWRAIIDRHIRNLTADLVFDPEKYVMAETLLDIVVDRLAQTYPLTTHYHVDYPEEVIRDDRGMGRVLERPLLGKIEEHNDLLDRRDQADYLKLKRRQGRGGANHK